MHEGRLVSIVYLVCLVCLVEPDRPDEQEKPSPVPLVLRGNPYSRNEATLTLAPPSSAER